MRRFIPYTQRHGGTPIASISRVLHEASVEFGARAVVSDLYFGVWALVALTICALGVAAL